MTELSPIMQDIRTKMAAWIAEALSPEEQEELSKWAVMPTEAISEEPVDKWAAVFGHIAEAMGVTAPLSYTQRNILHETTNEICELLDKCEKKSWVEIDMVRHHVMNTVGTQFATKFRGYAEHISSVTEKAVTAIVKVYYGEEVP